MTKLKVVKVPAYYRGIKFKTMAEARWAVFFDACKVEWDYRPEGFDCWGQVYVPSFKLYGLEGRIKGDIYVDVITDLNEFKVERMFMFKAGYSDTIEEITLRDKCPLLLVGAFPKGKTLDEIDKDIRQKWCERINSKFEPENRSLYAYLYNYLTLDGDDFSLTLGINEKGKFNLFGAASTYMAERDKQKTFSAYSYAMKYDLHFSEEYEDGVYFDD